MEMPRQFMLKLPDDLRLELAQTMRDNRKLTLTEAVVSLMRIGCASIREVKSKK